jgi:hypothetical protein
MNIGDLDKYSSTNTVLNDTQSISANVCDLRTIEQRFEGDA